jgi:hypothetical protein
MGNNGKQGKIKLLLSVGVTHDIKNALELAAEFTGSTCSQLGRQAILQFLVREGFLQHPAAIYQQQQAARSQPAHPAE